MRDISAALESLEVVAGLHSFYLIVDPSSSADDGFLGGTVLGREFWRGHRGCGAPGAQAFKLFCQKSALHHSHASPSSSHFQQEVKAAGVQLSKKSTASAVKSEVYATVRNAVRFGLSPSGRNADR